MKIVRTVTIGLMLSITVLQFIYIPFINYFRNNSTVFAFSYALEATGYVPFHNLTSSMMMLCLSVLSLAMGLFIASFIYSPIEDIAIAKFKSIFDMKKD